MKKYHFGITGSIACGKSTITAYLQENKYKVIDSDKIVHELLKKGNTVYEDVVKHFGETILDENKQINRSVLGSIIFNNKEKKNELEKIIHPAVINRIYQYFEESKETIFVEVPLLYEAHMENMFDKIIVVYVNQEKQIERLIKRDTISIPEAIKRINSQMSLEEKIKKADFVIDNSKDLDYTIKQLKDILKGIK